MPITIGVSLEENGTRGVLRSISGNGKRFGKVREVEDGARQEEFLQRVERLLASWGPISMIVFLGEVKERVGDSRVVGYELIVEVGKAKKGSYILYFG